MTRKQRVGKLSIAYELTGPENAPVVCLAHCFTTDHRFWDAQMDALVDFRVLRFDARGHGESDKPPAAYTLSMMADDVAGLIESLSLGAVNYVGVSMGAMIGQTLALEHPHLVKSLTLANVPCEYRDDQITLWRERAEEVNQGGIEAVHAGLMSRWFTDEAAQNAIPGYTYLDQTLPKFTPRCFASVTEAMCGLNTTSRLKTLNVPVMLIASPDDPGVPQEISELMARLIPDTRLHWLHPARHLATLEHPERFNELLLEFLEEVT